MGALVAMAAVGAATKIGGSLMGTASANKAAAAEIQAAETSKILEAAFFDEEVGGIIAESARLVGAAEAEAGVRGVKSTTGSALARVAEIRRAGNRELLTAAQETVLTRHGFDQAAKRAAERAREARIQGGLAVAGFTVQGASSMMRAKAGSRSSSGGGSGNSVGTT